MEGLIAALEQAMRDTVDAQDVHRIWATLEAVRTELWWARTLDAGTYAVILEARFG